MAVRNSQVKAQAKYDRQNTRQIMFKFNKKTDEDILEKLDTVDNRQGYIKELIRGDLQGNNYQIRDRNQNKEQEQCQDQNDHYETAYDHESASGYHLRQTLEELVSGYEEDGIQKGQERMAALILYIIKSGMGIDEIAKAAENPLYREELYQRFQISPSYKNM